MTNGTKIAIQWKRVEIDSGYYDFLMRGSEVTSFMYGTYSFIASSTSFIYPPTQPLAIINLLSISTILLFQECYTYEGYSM